MDRVLVASRSVIRRKKTKVTFMARISKLSPFKTEITFLTTIITLRTKFRLSL